MPMVRVVPRIVSVMMRVVPKILCDPNDDMTFNTVTQELKYLELKWLC